MASPGKAQVLGAQAGYYLTTGIWPLVHRRSFEAVTGPKVDFWLVRTVGINVAAIGAGLAVAIRRGTLSPEMRATAMVAAAGLGVVDAIYVAKRRIRSVYLLDAVAEALFVATLAKGESRPGR